MMIAHHQVRLFRVLIGVLMVVSGMFALVVTIIAAAAPTPEFDRLAFTLGLAGGLLLSAVAQVAGLIGVWLAWTAMPHHRR